MSGSFLGLLYFELAFGTAVFSTRVALALLARSFAQSLMPRICSSMVWERGDHGADDGFEVRLREFNAVVKGVVEGSG